MIGKNNLPKHIAIIMDGNGRWAKQCGLPRIRGHIEGIKRVEEIVDIASQSGIKVLTLFAFSTENWNRPKDEVSMLMRAFVSFLNKKIKKINEENIKLQFIGRRNNRISKILLDSMNSAEKLTRNNTGMVLNVAFNYGSRAEILDATKKIARDVRDKKTSIDKITEETINNALYTKDLPDPDLLIRTSGEKRISNFLLWQLSYSEIYFTDKFWPDFNKKEFKKAMVDFQQRERRYGYV